MHELPESVMVKSMPTCFVLKFGQGYASGPVNGDCHGFGDLPELDDTANASAEQDHCASFIVQQVQKDDQLQHTSNSFQSQNIYFNSETSSLH